MEDALLNNRLQFAFTITYHYLYPQLTMGLALLIVILKGLALKKNDERFNHAARFWAKIFGINFAMGVVTGIPMEFQFGTNWAKFSAFAGGVIGHTLAMEGMFAFFLESSFLGLFLWGEKKLGQAGHFIVACLIFLGSWLSAYLIVATNAWMQHPVGYVMGDEGAVHLSSFWELILNPWAGWQYAHTMMGALTTSAFVMASVGAYYLLAKRDAEYGRMFVRFGVSTALISSILLLFPTGDMESKNVAKHQPTKFAGMEGIFETKEGVELVFIGQPDMEKLKLDNPLYVPKLLSFLTHFRWEAEILGLASFPQEDWPHNVPLLYYSYHIMVGLGTMFIAVAIMAALLLWRKRLFEARWALWILMLSFPFPYIANTAGWWTAEVGRQPWLVWGLMRTADGISPTVSAGNSLFTLIGFIGLYFVLGVLFLLLVIRQINSGPEGQDKH
jgi:cytochrome d ubiquinol oxidase subunit I